MKTKIILSLIFLSVVSWHSAICRNIGLEWQIGYHPTETEQPAKWFASTVPGAVQLDVMRAENYKQPWWYADHVLQFDWMEDVWFTYRTSFKKPALQNGERLFFFSKGIDYQFKIHINQQLIHEQEGMFTYVNIDITDYLQDNNELKIVLLPVPNLGFSFDEFPDSYRRNARESAKPAVSYGWDWHPRLVTRGIWDETSLVVRKSAHLSDVAVGYTLNGDLTQAKVQAVVEGVELQGCYFKWVMKNPQGKIVLEKMERLTGVRHTIESELSDIMLWQPAGYGAQHLYVNEFTLFDANQQALERQSCKTGFRTIRLSLNEGAWPAAGDGNFPLSSPYSPITMEVNHRRIFAKGSNWVHPEVFVGTLDAERYREQLSLVKNANFNILRIWGGGIVNKESFFDICDESGILVWQEFPLACNYYADDEKYLKVLEQEARSIINRVKKHACLALWSGGNELFWGGMTEQSLPLRLLNSLCYQLNPQTPFIYTSPINGIGHGHYVFYDATIDKEVFQWMANARKTAYTEYGVPGTANLDVLKSFIPDNELFPPKNNTAWEIHHGFNAWGADRWLEIPTLEKYFGSIKSIEELVKYGQLLQCEGLKFIYEEARRQKPACSMALNWCFQEPWPTAANNSLINWPSEIKPAYYHVANACRPVSASARIPKIEWKEGEAFNADLYLLNDAYDKLTNEKITVFMQYDDTEKELASWDCPATDQGFTNVKGPTIQSTIPSMKTNLFTIHVCVAGKPEYNSTYTLLFSGKNVQKRYPSDDYYHGKTR